MSERASTNIQIEGVRATAKALDAFAPELKKRMNKEIRQAMTRVKAQAEANYPEGAWSLNINSKRILGSIVARGGTRATKWSESDPGVKAAIFEFAGSLQPGKTPQAAGLIKSLNNRYGQPGRFLWAAWDTQGRQALTRIKAAVLAAERDLQDKLDAAGESY